MHNVPKLPILMCKLPIQTGWEKYTNLRKLKKGILHEQIKEKKSKNLDY